MMTIIRLCCVALAAFLSTNEGKADVCLSKSDATDPALLCEFTYNFDEYVFDSRVVDVRIFLGSPAFAASPDGRPIVSQFFYVALKSQSVADRINSEFESVQAGLMRALSHLKEGLCAKEDFRSFVRAGGSAELGYRIYAQNAGVRLIAYPEASVLILSCEAP
jgi:hypothetical protein